MFVFLADKRHLFCPVVMVALTDQMARKTIKKEHIGSQPGKDVWHPAFDIILLRKAVKK